MSDETTKTDAEVIAEMREHILDLPPRPWRWGWDQDEILPYPENTALCSTLIAADNTPIFDLGYHDGHHLTLPHGASITGEFFEKSAIFADAALRTIDALTAERDAARAELATLREACTGSPDMMDEMLGFLRAETGWMRVSYDEYAAEIAAKAAALRAALGNERKDGTP